MLFATHLVLGAILGRSRFPTLWVVFGAALPDIVDKPLAMAGTIPTYHSIVHSALFGSVFVVALLLTGKSDRTPSSRPVTAVLLGWASHLGADALHITLNGRAANTVFLLWPVVDTWDSIDTGPGAFLVQYIGTTSSYVDLLIWSVGGYLLVRASLPDRGRNAS